MRKVDYLIDIDRPANNMVKMSLNASRSQDESITILKLANWSPGSYLIRDYARHIRSIKANDSMGRTLHLTQLTKNTWQIDWNNKDLASSELQFTVEYEVYCHELTVRTSHVDISHAFLHGPCIFLMLEDEKSQVEGTVQVKFPGLWSAINTALEEVSTKREEFIYKFQDYDELLDSPFEIGCQETNGFKYKDVDHYIAVYGKNFNNVDFKNDLVKIVEVVASLFDEKLPYSQYHFILHLKKGLYGGLEHLDSCACQFDPFALNIKSEYNNFLALMAHEYFHTWNVKRIRPKELGPFDYDNENYTKMLWLAEGLTSFMDDLFVYRAGFTSLEEYLEIVKKYLNRYLSIPGKRFHSLEDSSFNAWVKLYKRDENTNNSSISYYLKGGLVFMVLNFLLNDHGKSMNDLIKSLWDHYKSRPNQGITRDEFLDLILNLSNKDVVEKFEEMISTTKDIDFLKYFEDYGMTFDMEDFESQPYELGLKYRYEGERVFVQEVMLDSSGYKSGINPEDEVLSIDGIRVTKSNLGSIEKALKQNKKYSMFLSRLGEVCNVDVFVDKKLSMIKSIRILDKDRAESAFL